MNPISFYQLSAQHSPTCYSTGAWIDGVHMKRLEKRLQEYFDCEFVLLTNSGTSSLLAAYYALRDDFDTLTVDPYTFPATYQPARFLQYNVRFKKSILKDETLTSDTLNAVVHLFGQPMRMPATPTDAPYLEDVAQAFGAEYAGRKLGTFGMIGCLSFYPTKILHTCGHGGAIITSERRLFEKMKPFVECGRVNGKMTEIPGLNLRLDEIKAEFLLHELDQIEEVIERQREIALRYRQLVPGYQPLLEERDGDRHVYSTFNMLLDDRDEFRAFMSSRKIDTMVYYDESILPESLRPSYQDITGRVVAVPCRATLTNGEVTRIEDALGEWFSSVSLEPAA